MRMRTRIGGGLLGLALLLSFPVSADEGEYQEEGRASRWGAVALDVILLLFTGKKKGLTSPSDHKV